MRYQEYPEILTEQQKEVQRKEETISEFSQLVKKNPIIFA